MAAAFGALVSLLNDLVNIQNHPYHSFSFDSNQIQSLHESVTFLIDFMESYDNFHGPSKEAAQLLELPITRAAYAAEEVIESHVVDQIRSGSTRDGKKRSNFLPDLQKVIEGVDVVRREAMEVQAQSGIKLKQQPTNSAAAASSTPPITSEKNSMVGFDEVLLQLLDLLTGHPPSRRVIPIVGTGGIDTRNGSRVIVTTRQSDVAHHLSYSKLAMSILDDEKSWNLFCQKAFAGQGCPRELEEVGKEIVRKCKGLPLAIVVVAGYLAKSSRMEEYWKSVSSNMSSTLNSEENYKQLLDVLSFSYSHLPVHLKPCFVSMGMLEEDEKISVLEIINRWIAEGYLKPCNAENLEEIAEDYLKDLIDRNLILADKDFSEVGIHDILRELCLNIVEKEMFFYVVETVPEAICREREVGTPIVRSLRWPAKGEVSLNLKLLRVLYKKDEFNRSYLEANLEQVNLRYLQYRKNYKRVIPRTYLHLSPAIILLWNLQTLIIQEGMNTLCVAPYEIWEMLQLRHVDVLDYIRLPSVKSEQGDELVMRNLRTLKRVKNFKMSEEVCRRLPNIKELIIDYDDSNRECDEVRSYYCPHNLGSFCKLESLNCKVGGSPSWREFALGLAFPTSLKELSLENSQLHWEEMATKVGSLPHLETLQLGLNSITDSEWHPVEGEFLRLKNLSISDCYELVYLNADSSCFPVLENLVLYNLSRLDEFPSGIGEIPTLQSILLEECSVSCAISAVRVVMEQGEEFGNQDLRLRVCTIDDEERESLNSMVEEEGLTTKNVGITNTIYA